MNSGRIVIFTFVLGLASAVPAAAQQPQNPSPMVEHTREHRRVEKQSPPGRRETLELGTLFIPDKFDRKIKSAKLKSLPLLVFFHGGTWMPEYAAATEGRSAAISIQIGAGSGVYARAFSDPTRFLKLLQEAEQKAGAKFSPVTLGGWSAGNGAIREILKPEESYARVDRVIAIDGIHAGYVDGKPGPQESQLETDNLQIWLKLARDAVAGKKRLLITHSEIFPGTYASTTETADWLLRELGLKRKPVVAWGPKGMQLLSEVRAGNLVVRGYAGNSAPDHVDQLHALADFLNERK
jgi:hypothetical protein